MPSAMAISPTLHPAWKEAVAEFKRAGFKEGDVVTHDWLFENFQIEKPSHLTYVDGKTIELEKLASFHRFQKRLLEDHLVALRPIRGLGYEVVPPAEQTRHFFRDGMKRISRTLRKTADYVTFVDDTKLSPAQIKENTDAQARIANMDAMLSRSRRLPKP